MKSMMFSVLVAAAACMSGLEVRAAQPAAGVPAAGVPAAGVPAAGQEAPAKVAAHSHLQEKTGMTPQKKPGKAKSDEARNAEAVPEEAKAGDQGADRTAAKKTARLRADKDKSRHYHPRDAK